MTHRSELTASHVNVGLRVTFAQHAASEQLVFALHIDTNLLSESRDALNFVVSTFDLVTVRATLVGWTLVLS